MNSRLFFMSDKNKILIKGGTILSMNPSREILEGDILVEDNKIVAIQKSINTTVDLTIDATKSIITPGFIQLHTHLCQTFFRNIAENVKLLDWLYEKILPLEAAHTEESLYYCALLGSYEVISSGTTTILDMGTVNHTDSVFRAMKEIGLRGFSGNVLMNKGEHIPSSMLETNEEILKKSERLLKKWNNSAGGRLKYALSPRFALSCSKDLFLNLKEFAKEYEDLLFHSHSSEDQTELNEVIESTGSRNIEFFHKLGLTGKNLILAHCIWLNEKELSILEETQTRVAHCPSSNLKLASGIADIPELLKRGIKAGLGADGAPCNNNLSALNEARFASLIQKPKYGPKVMPPEKVIEMLTIDAAEILGLEDEIGSIEEGKKADITIVDLEKSNSLSAPNVNSYGALVYSCTPKNIQTVLINGEIVYKNGKLQSYSPRAIIENSKPLMKNLTEKVLD